MKAVTESYFVQYRKSQLLQIKAKIILPLGFYHQLISFLVQYKNKQNIWPDNYQMNNKRMKRHVILPLI